MFYTNQSVQEGKKYDTSAATMNARISAMLQYILCTSRFAHYLKVMARDKIGSFQEAGECEEYLHNWLQQYVTSDAEASPATKARFPLREARVKVEENRSRPGSYLCTAHLWPHFQLDGLTAAIRLRTGAAGKGGIEVREDCEMQIEKCKLKNANLRSSSFNRHYFRPSSDHRFRAVPIQNLLPSRRADLPRRVGMIEQVLGPAGDAGAMAGGEEVAGLFVLDQVARARHVGSDHRHARGHRFQYRPAAALRAGRWTRTGPEVAAIGGSRRGRRGSGPCRRFRPDRESERADRDKARRRRRADGRRRG